MSLIIDPSYDSSVTNLDNPSSAAYDPTLYAEFTAAVQTAIQFFENAITNPITVKINFGWGEVAGSTIDSGAIGESSTTTIDYTYSKLLTAGRATDTTSAVQQAAVNTLPGTDPTSGAHFSVATAEAKALGLNTSFNGTDGSVGLDSTQKYSWTQTSIAAGTYDAVGTIEHEISEVLGREDTGGAGNTYTLLDMFRYTAANGQAGDAPGSAVGARDEPFAAGYSANSYSYFSYNGSTVTLQYDIPSQVTQGADVGDWAATVPADSFGYADQSQKSLVSTTDLQEMNVLGYDLACYLPDTRITTPFGDVAVQDLAVGDHVLTHRGEARPIVWIGHGKALATSGRRSTVSPVIVRRNALSDNVPNRNLRITKGHALYLDEVLIPAEFLVNHRSIVWDDHVGEITVYHIELDVHDVLLADGAPAESFRDDGNRWVFQNNESGQNQPDKPVCAPVLTGGPVVDAVWQRLLDRCGPRPALSLTEDADLHLLVNGCRVDGQPQPNGMHGFRLTSAPITVRIVSRADAQDKLGLARDPRPLGIAIRQIVIWRGARPTVIDAGDERLCVGFHDYEADNYFRWTDGAATLPAALFEGGGRVTSIDLGVASTTHYQLFPQTAAEAA